MPRVLIVSYHFPPAAGVAPARVGKLAKYLPTQGWEPVVVASPPTGRTDSDLAADVAGIDVHYVRARPFAPRLQRLDWAVTVLPYVRRLARDADVVLVSGAPFAPLLLGRASRKPYVVDLRDPWSWEPRFGRFAGGAKRRVALALERRAERIALRGAKAIVTVAPEIAARYERDDVKLRGRVTVVRHGFDPDDFSAPTEPPPTPPTLVHVGTMLAGERTPELILETARRVRARGHELRVRLIGAMEEGLRPAAEDWIEIVGPLRHRSAAHAMMAASVLWVQPGELDFLITGKVYEYLAAGRPIVAVAPPTGSVARLLATTGGAAVVRADAEACADAVVAALRGAVGPRDEAAIAALAQPAPAAALAEALGR